MAVQAPLDSTDQVTGGMSPAVQMGQPRRLRLMQAERKGCRRCVSRNACENASRSSGPRACSRMGKDEAYSGQSSRQIVVFKGCERQRKQGTRRIVDRVSRQIMLRRDGGLCWHEDSMLGDDETIQPNYDPLRRARVSREKLV